MESSLNSSYCHGSTDVPLQFWRSFDRLQHWAEQAPDKEIIVFRQPNSARQAISFARYHRLTDGVAAHLISGYPNLHVRDIVLLMGPNSFSYCVVAAGVQKAGLVSLKLHPQTQASLLQSVSKAGAKAVIYFADNDIFEVGANWLQDSAVSIRIEFDSLLRSAQELVDSTETGELQVLLKERQAQVSADDSCCIYPTSGTTGPPKLVPHSHFSMVNSVRFRAISALLTSDDIFFTDRPTAHVVGDFGLLMAMVSGLTLIVAPTNTFAGDRCSKNANWLLDMLTEERVTSGDFFGYLVHDMLNKACREPPKTLRSALIAGSMTTSQQMGKAMTLLPGIVNYYGTTEANIITAPCPPWGPADDRQARRDTVGRPAMHMELLVTDPSNRDAIPLPLGSTGEIWARGFSVTRGYIDDLEKTREAITETGWYRTGDLGYIDANGRLTVTGRIKDLIIRAAVNISPITVEEVLRTHPDVLEVLVLGVPDERLGEEVAACVVLRPESQERQLRSERETALKLARWCLSQGLAESRDGLPTAPRYWAILADFPTSRIGKVVRSEVREQVALSKGFIDGLELFRKH